MKLKARKGTLTKTEIYQAVCDLCIKLNKEVLHLTSIDFLSNPNSRYVYQFW
jgi:hypothetical protein